MQEFTAAAFNPSGETVVVGSFNRFRTFTLNQHDGSWEDTGAKQIDNLYTITALSWKCDGSRLTCGSLCGSCPIKAIPTQTPTLCRDLKHTQTHPCLATAYAMCTPDTNQAHHTTPPPRSQSQT